MGRVIGGARAHGGIVRYRNPLSVSENNARSITYYSPQHASKHLDTVGLLGGSTEARLAAAISSQISNRKFADQSSRGL